MTTLADLIASRLPTAVTVAPEIAALQEQWKAGIITQAECQDLCVDLIRETALEEDMTDLVLRQRITEAFTALRAIAVTGVVPL